MDIISGCDANEMIVLDSRPISTTLYYNDLVSSAMVIIISQQADERLNMVSRRRPASPQPAYCNEVVSSATHMALGHNANEIASLDS
jgi:hypothetical protein